MSPVSAGHHTCKVTSNVSVKCHNKALGDMSRLGASPQWAASQGLHECAEDGTEKEVPSPNEAGHDQWVMLQPLALAALVGMMSLSG